jgi:hypothetical protein
VVLTDVRLALALAFARCLPVSNLYDLTVRPAVHRGQLVLSWMQLYPEKWDGYHPHQCVDLASYLNSIGSE